MHLCINVMCVVGAHEGQKRASYSLELELWVALSAKN